jgi:hypothetical protein
VLEPRAALPLPTQLATVFHLPASLSALPLSPSTLNTIADFIDGQATSTDAIKPSSKKSLDLLGRQSPNLRVPTNELGPNLEKALLRNDLPTKFVKWREIAADQNQWRAIWGMNMPSATKKTPIFLTTRHLK